VSTTTADVEVYSARVRAALADLPAADRDDLLADLEDHLAEVAAEGPLDELLGTPEAYAAELRSSAGLPAGGRPGRWPGLAGQPWLRPVLDFLPELRPGWWVLRGLLVAWVMAMWSGGGLPMLAALSVLLVPASVVLGRRSAADPRLRWAGIAASAATVLALLLFTTVVGSDVGSAPAPYPAVPDTTGLTGVTNLYPYDQDGRPLTDVQLFDQDGHPVDLTGTTDLSGNRITQVARRTADGQVVNNVFPQRQTVEDPMNPSADGLPAQLPVVPPGVRAPKLSAG
jgi:hypothetical protein